MKKYNILSQSVPSKKVLSEEQIKVFNKKMEEVRIKASINAKIAWENAGKVLINR